MEIEIFWENFKIYIQKSQWKFAFLPIFSLILQDFCQDDLVLVFWNENGNPSASFSFRLEIYSKFSPFDSTILIFKGGSFSVQLINEIEIQKFYTSLNIFTYNAVNSKLENFQKMLKKQWKNYNFLENF